MTDFLPIIAVIVIAAVAIFILAYRAKNQIIAAKQKTTQLKQEADQKTAELTQAYDEARQQADYLQREIDSLSQFKEIRDVAAKAEQIRSSIKTLQEAAQHKAQVLWEGVQNVRAFAIALEAGRAIYGGGG